ncbi:MAG: putative Ig domain-containing protein [Prosthecobacter sp.]|nr:putative Ig domain-containing protein [Prosthecobacter sp.]
MRCLFWLLMLPIGLQAGPVHEVLASFNARPQVPGYGAVPAGPLPGDLDLTFNTTGQVITPISGQWDDAFGVAVQSDGKIVVAGMADMPGGMDFALIRYNIDGSLDSGFGDDGIRIIDFNGGGDVPQGVVIQSNGKIVVAGYSHVGGVGATDFAVARCHPDGSLDGTFGSGGKVTTAIGSSYDSGYSVAVQTDGKILVAGSSTGANGDDIAVVRYNTNGSLDAGFGSGGKMITDIAGNPDYAYGVAVQSDGKVVVTGYYHATANGGTSGASNVGLVLLRYRTNGTLDTAFGSGGKVTMLVPGGDIFGYAIAMQSDSRIVVAGYAYDSNENDSDIAVVRFNTNGSVDTDFGSGGKAVAGFPGSGSEDRGHSLAIQKDGKIIVGGNFESDVALVRFRANGVLDPSFGSGGTVRTEFINSNARWKIAPQSDEKIVVAGRVAPGGKTDITVLQYSNGPAPEISMSESITGTLADGGAIPFGNVGIGGQRSTVLNIENVGTADLTDLTATLDGPHAGMFRFVQPAAAAVPNSNVGLMLEYVPTALGEHFAFLHITSNDADESPFDITLTGTGVRAVNVALKTLPATDVSFDVATLNGTMDPKGEGSALFFDYGVTAGYGSSIDATAYDIGPGGLIKIAAVPGGLLPHTRYYFRLRAMGILGPAVGAGLTFTTQNRPPEVLNEILSILPGAVVTLDVPANDSDPDGDAVSIASNTVVSAAQGKIVKRNQKFVFIAASTFDGAAFDYVVKDNYGGMATGSVTLTLGTSSINTPEKALESVGGTYAVGVAAAGSWWSVSEMPPWVSATPAVKNGSGLAQITVQPNAGKAERTATIKIAGKPHVVTQAGVMPPEISLPDPVPGAMVGVDFVLAIPTVNAPVTYMVSTPRLIGYGIMVLPPGLTFNQTTGVMSGKPTRAGTYAVVIKARNAAGPAPTALSFDIVVTALPEGLVGTFHGYIPGDAELNAQVGSRFAMTTTATGAVSGKIITGVTAKSFAGKLDASLTEPTQAQFVSGAPLNLVLTLNAAANAVTGTASGVPMNAWRQVWKAITNPATAYKGLHTFHLNPPDADPDAPQGHGYGSFTVDEKTGSLKIIGKLADGNALLTTTFVGPNGQVLLYQPLYGNKGSFGGVLAVAVDRAITGTASWYKPGEFGPSECSASGGGPVR